MLDAIAAPLRTRKEKTYSAPLATHLFAKETVELPDGRQAREFPAAAITAARISRTRQRDWCRDIARSGVARALRRGAVLWIAAGDAVCAPAGARSADRGMDAAWRAVWRGETEVPWRAMLVTLGVMLLIGVPLLALAAKYHVLGTDKVGQDVFYQSLKSIRTGLVIGTLTTLVMLPFALLLGIMAGYFRGWVDDVIQYLYTTLSLDSRRAADRGGGADDAGLHREPIPTCSDDRDGSAPTCGCCSCA